MIKELKLKIPFPYQYLLPTSSNCLNIDHGLIEALTIKLKDQTLTPEHTWFDSICKFVYEKLKVYFYYFHLYDVVDVEFDYLSSLERRNFPNEFLPKLCLQKAITRIGVLWTKYGEH